MKNFILGVLSVGILGLGYVVYLQATGRSPLDVLGIDSTPAGTLALDVTAAGGTLRVERPGSAIDGLTLIVPPGAFPKPRRVRISERPLPSSPRPAGVSALTPMITVDMGDGYADDFITVRLPVAVPPGHFAMAFLVNEQGRILEGLPVLDVQSDAVRVATRHFSSLAVFSIAETLLTSKPTLHTGFTPGVDDWQFPNQGSIVRPYGHCAGQVISAMWYYYERRLAAREPPLHGRYQAGVEGFWRDDAQPYMLASTVQADLDWSSWTKKVLKTMGKTRPEFVWHAFLFAMLATGEPQLVGVYRTTPPGGGHALVAHKASVLDRVLHVVDPNFPGETGRRRKIAWQDAGPEPYVSAPSAQQSETPVAYDLICYFGKSIFADWRKLGTRFAQLEAGAMAGTFPSTRLLVLAEGDTAHDASGAVDLGAGTFETSDAAITVRPLVTAQGGTPAWARLSVYREEGGKAVQFADTVKNRAGARIPLAWGANRVGYFTRSRVMRPQPAGAPIESWTWTDFRWLTVKRQLDDVHVVPAFLQGRAGKQYRFTLNRRNKTLSMAGVRYQWSWGDGQTVRSKVPYALHTWKNPGPYILSVTVLSDRGAVVAETSTTLRMHAEPKKDIPTPARGEAEEEEAPPKKQESTHEVTFAEGYTLKKGGPRLSKDVRWTAPGPGTVSALYTYKGPIGSNLSYDNGHYVAWMRWKAEDEDLAAPGRRTVARMSGIENGKFRVRKQASISATIKVKKGGVITFTLSPEITEARRNSNGTWSDDYYQAKHYHGLGGVGTLQLSFVPAR